MGPIFNKEFLARGVTFPGSQVQSRLARVCLLIDFDAGNGQQYPDGLCVTIKSSHVASRPALVVLIFNQVGGNGQQCPGGLCVALMSSQVESRVAIVILGVGQGAVASNIWMASVLPSEQPGEEPFCHCYRTPRPNSLP